MTASALRRGRPRRGDIGFKWGIPVLLALFGVIVVMRRLRH